MTEATWPWRGWKPLRTLWLVLIAVLVAASPLYLADMHGMLPAAMVLVFAIGPLNALASIRATCLDCGAVVERSTKAKARSTRALRAFGTSRQT